MCYELVTIRIFIYLAHCNMCIRRFKRLSRQRAFLLLLRVSAAINYIGNTLSVVSVRPGRKKETLCRPNKSIDRSQPPNSRPPRFFCHFQGHPLREGFCLTVSVCHWHLHCPNKCRRYFASLGLPCVIKNLFLRTGGVNHNSLPTLWDRVRLGMRNLRLIKRH